MASGEVVKKCCCICMESFNNTSRKLFTCQFSCHMDDSSEKDRCCFACAKNYIVSRSMDLPHCFACRKPFSNSFIDETFTFAFRNNDLRKAMEEQLYAREMATIHDAQALAAEYKIITEKHQRLLSEFDGDKKAFKAAREQDIRDIDVEIARLKAKKMETRSEITFVNMHAQPVSILKAAREALTPSSCIKKVSLDKRTIRCPADGCRGVVRDQEDSGVGKCGMCGVDVCIACEKTICGATLVGDDKKRHECNKDDLASVEEIKKTSKPCPWEGCGAQISKTSGCSQMWCVNCNRPFDWNTEKRIIGNTAIHNPHYFEYQQRLHASRGDVENDAVPLARRDCEAINYIDMRKNAHLGTLNARLRMVNHMHAVSIIEASDKFAHDMEIQIDLARCMWLNGYIDDKELRRRAYLRGREERYHIEMMQVLEAAVRSHWDVLRQLRKSKNAVLKDAVMEDTEACRKAVEEQNMLAGVINTSLLELGKRQQQNTIIRIIEHSWTLDRFTLRTNKRTRVDDDASKSDDASKNVDDEADGSEPGAEGVVA